MNKSSIHQKFQEQVDENIRKIMGCKTELYYPSVVIGIFDRIGINVGDFVVYHVVENMLFDLNGLRVPMASLKFIPIEHINAVRLNNRTLHVVTENCKHVIVEAFDSVVAYPNVNSFTTSRPCSSTFISPGYTTRHENREPLTNIMESI